MAEQTGWLMKYTLDDIKRMSICPILFKEKWDYTDNDSKLIPSYLYGIKEMFRWYYRRGKQISPDAITASVSHHCFQTKVPFETKANLETALRKYASSGLYRKIEQPFYNKEIEIYLNKEGDLIQYKIPTLSKLEKSFYIYSFDLGKVDEGMFLNRYETLLVSFWSFFSFNKTPVFLNLYFDGESIVEQKIKVTMDYIEEAKRKIHRIGKEINKKQSLPPSEVCENCNRRTECPNLKTTNLLQKR
jgi:hypothetical protein